MSGAKDEAASREPPKGPPGPVLKAAEADSWIDGFAFRDRARREADALLAGMTKAREETRRDGYETGRRQGAGAAAELLATTARDVDAYLAGLEGEIVELALQIVRRIAGDEPAPDLVARLAREALAGFRREQRLVVTVAPENFEAVRGKLAAEGAGDRLTVESDAALGSLDCRVSSPYATVDAGLDAQLDAVRRELSAGEP